MEKAYEITPNDKKIVFVGVPTEKINIYTLPLAFKKTLLVSSGGACVQRSIYQDILNYN